MSFSHVSNILKAKFDEHAKNHDILFTVDLDKDELYALYLDSFPEGTNPIFRERREFDCSTCRQFIKNIGATVWIDDELNVHSLFEVDTESPDQYQPVFNALDAFVKQHRINGIYINFQQKVGSAVTHAVEDGEVVEYEHFEVILPNYMFAKKTEIGTLCGTYNSTKDVFKRSLDEITIESVNTVLELISSNSLYRGEEWKRNLETFKSHKLKYDQLTDDQKNLYAWKQSGSVGNVIGHIRNHSIGQLLIDISGDMELDQAVSRYEKIVAPANYKRPKAIFTKKMLEEAQKKVEALGLMNSLPRRFATLDDITVNNILFANRNVAKKISGNVFDDMAGEVTVNPKNFSKVEEIPVDKFLSDVLPNVSDVEVLMQNSLMKNLVSVIAPKDKTAPTMFKWNNGFSWAYQGNMADSDIRENVKAAGGKVDGVLRFSIQWNDGSDFDMNDEDAHCDISQENGYKGHIYYADKFDRSTGGELDVDIIQPIVGKAAVENITWQRKDLLKDGTYKFYVHCFACRGGQSGFRAEIEFEGNIYSFDYSKPLRQGEKVEVATVTVKDGQFSIEEKLSGNVSSREVWGIKTNQFVPVNLIMYSPNYWDDQNGIGNRHYFFMLNGCVNPENPNGFYNEYLRNDLIEHKRVFEALGSKMKVEDDPNQLSGVGFCSTRRNELIVRVKGNIQRIMKIKF